MKDHEGDEPGRRRYRALFISEALSREQLRLRALADTVGICWSSRGATKQPLLSQAQARRKLGYAPRVLVTDELQSYGAARRQLGLSARHEQGLRKNNPSRKKRANST